ESVARTIPFAERGREILRIDALVGRAQRTAPDLPRALCGAQALEEPFLLLRAQHRLRRFIRAVICHALFAEAQLRRRMAVGVLAAGVELRPQFLRNETEFVTFEQ